MIARDSNKLVAKRMSGFTLIEVLVAMIVLSIGLLGLAGLQLTSLKAADSAYFRSQAMVLADDVLDRMRSNRAAALAEDYDVAIGSSPSGTTVADKDLIEWRTMLGGTLTSGTGAVDVNSDGVATVTIQWDDSRGGGGSTEQITVVSQL